MGLSDVDRCGSAEFAATRPVISRYLQNKGELEKRRRIEARDVFQAISVRGSAQLSMKI